MRQLDGHLLDYCTSTPPHGLILVGAPYLSVALGLNPKHLIFLHDVLEVLYVVLVGHLALPLFVSI